MTELITGVVQPKFSPLQEQNKFGVPLSREACFQAYWNYKKKLSDNYYITRNSMFKQLYKDISENLFPILDIRTNQSQHSEVRNPRTTYI